VSAASQFFISPAGPALIRIQGDASCMN
jgi:hypothetical protein